jgi:hypothetical protein
MKLLWRCRCEMEIPILDDEEFRQAIALRGTGTGDMRECYLGPVLREYERITLRTRGKHPRLLPP